MNKYKVLHKQHFKNGDYSIVPIRMEDQYAIMKWRNEQMFHLRQNKPLTREAQEVYFKDVVAQLFNKEKPDQILFSYLKGKTCIGYGGLVHINWIDRNAEISFIMDTKLEKSEFELHWTTYLSMIEDVGFNDLKLHKIFTYAYDLRPQLYTAIEKVGFAKEATLKEHCFFNNEFKDVIIHSKKRFAQKLQRRDATINDCHLLFKWANDTTVRTQSFNHSKIPYDRHKQWFNEKLKSPNCSISIFSIADDLVGQIRIDKENQDFIIGISIDEAHRGKGLAPQMLKKALAHHWNTHDDEVYAYIKPSNLASKKAFEACGFVFQKNLTVNTCNALMYRITKKGHE